jgi:hypothetical protein
MRQSKVDELLGQVTNPALKAFLEGFKEATELADHYAAGGDGKMDDLLDPARTQAQAKGRELGESLLVHLVH